MKIKTIETMANHPSKTSNHMTKTSDNCMQPDLYCEALGDFTLRRDCNNRGCVFNKNFNQK